MTPRRIGYNWRNTLSDFASIAGIFSGFCVALIGIVLGWSVADTPIFGVVTWGNVSVLLIGISAALFITASQLFLTAKDSNVWDLPKEYNQSLRKNFKSQGEDWEKIRERNLKYCSRFEHYGRKFYNFALFFTFLGLWFIIGPYNLLIATIVSGLGIGLEIWQGFYFKKINQKMRKALKK